MQLIMFVLTAALVFLVLPGTVAKVPLNNLYAVAAVHAIIFTVLYYYLCDAVWNTYEGFTGTPPKCPDGQIYIRSLRKCASQTYTDLTATIPVCSAGKTFYPAINKCANIGYTELDEPKCVAPKMYVKSLGKCATASYANQANPVNPNGCPGSLQYIDTLNKCGKTVITAGAAPTCDAGSIFSVATNTCNLITPAKIQTDKWDTSIYENQTEDADYVIPGSKYKGPITPSCSNSRMLNPTTCKCGNQDPKCPNNYSLGDPCYCWPT